MPVSMVLALLLIMVIKLKQLSIKDFLALQAQSKKALLFL